MDRRPRVMALPQTAGVNGTSSVGENPDTPAGRTPVKTGRRNSSLIRAGVREAPPKGVSATRPSAAL